MAVRREEFRVSVAGLRSAFDRLTESEKQDLMDQASFQLFSVSFNDALLSCTSIAIEEEVRKQVLTKAVVNSVG